MLLEPVIFRFNQLGRLSINTWMHNNPNALGHSVVLIIPMAFLLCFWNRTGVSRYLVAPIITALAFWCAWETQSKGAYVTGGILVASLFMMGRSFKVKVFVLAFILISGSSALSFLPRMSEMSNLRDQEGVQGRLLVWEEAREVSREKPTGEGWKKFEAWIPWWESGRIEWQKKGDPFQLCENRSGPRMDRSDDLPCRSVGSGAHSFECASPKYRRGALSPSNPGPSRSKHRFWLDDQPSVSHGAFSPHCSSCRLTPTSLGGGTKAGSRKQRWWGKGALGRKKHAISRAPILEDCLPGSGQGRSLWKRFSWKDVVVSLALTWLTFYTWDYLMANI